MADNAPKEIGKRLRLIDPSNFNYQYGIFDDTNINMSVPLEDLNIMVDLRTTSKARTILTTINNSNTSITTGTNSSGSDTISVKFIQGSNNNTTGKEEYLTTSYTDLSTELTDITETLGITNIDISFDSSYAPMVNIDFIDVRGGSIFQNGGESPYSVFFKLPYPIFELTIKGYYGKPVKYCLHMTKCNTKFNSQTGNFELATQFVGYTYALLSDMLLGYLKAAALTTRGEELLKARGVPSITEFLTKIANIDMLVNEQLINTENEDVKNLSVINDAKETLQSMQELVRSTVLFGLNNIAYEVPETLRQGVSLKETIAIVRYTEYDKENVETIIPKFCADLTNLIDKFNTQISIPDIQILIKPDCPVGLILENSDIVNGSEFLRNEIKKFYKTNDEANIDNIIERYRSAAKNVAGLNEFLVIYDLTDIMILVEAKANALVRKQDTLTESVAEQLRLLLNAKLGFDTSIRSIVNIFTTHVEIFLEQLYEVSSKYKDIVRVEELSKFKDTNNLDVPSKTLKDNVIYPWPEYSRENREEYLGSKTGPLTTPLNVPEIKFVEDLYTAMTIAQKKEEDLNTLTEGKQSWWGISPSDTALFSENKSPYDRLSDNSTPEDIARLVALRMVGFLGFANNLITTEELQAFAVQEANLILKRFSTSDKLLLGFKEVYRNPETSFYKLTGTVNGESTSLFNAENGLNYNYVFSNNGKKVLPIDGGFNNSTYELNGENSNTTIFLSNVNAKGVYKKDLSDTAKYVEFITRDRYENTNISSVSAISESLFVFNILNSNITNQDLIKQAGFIANSGRYGVQDFTAIVYDDGITAPYSSLFYADTISSERETFTVPALCRGRKTNFTSNFDIKDSITIVNSSSKLNAYTKDLITSHNEAGFNLGLISVSNNGGMKETLTYPSLTFDIVENSGGFLISLFGSRFYNAQNKFGRSFLFLHSLPWNGLAGEDVGMGEDNGGPFSVKAILNTFQQRSGVIQVPKLYIPFIGAILWRYKVGNIDKEGKRIDQSIPENSSVDPLVFQVNGEYILPDFTSQFFDAEDIPKTYQYLKSTTRSELEGRLEKSSKNSLSAMSFKSMEHFVTVDSYFNIEDTLIYLPEVVKEMFINEFIKFTENEFTTLIKPVFEFTPLGLVDDGDDTAWVGAFNQLNQIVSKTIDSGGDNKMSLSLSDFSRLLPLRNGNSPESVFQTLTFVTNNDNSSFGQFDKFKYNYIFEYKDSSIQSKTLRDIFLDTAYISNESILIWDEQTKNSSEIYSPITISNDAANLYFTEVINTITVAKESKQKERFNNNKESDEIKLEIYRTLKKIYDKWIAASPSKDNVMFQCCKRGANITERRSGDIELSKLRGDNGVLRLIDSFRFVTRSFTDIGNEFQINPLMISQQILENTNISFYDFISRILTDNNFDFIALPSYINFNNEDELKSMFKPYPYYEAVNLADTGPSFVCVYVGQTSTKLDFGKSSLYPNDSFDFTNLATLPKDFTTDKKPWEDMNAVFVVKYGQQNQSIFKDISLDQAEFTETAESLQITDSISNPNSITNKSYYGQNLYNVYSVRSYRADVEMLGNAMIQPMMYFQLDNIPMFHGAYMITKVRHAIKPNHMSTVFSGVRIRTTETPIVNAAALYSEILSAYSLPKASNNATLTSRVSGTFPPLVVTIIDNAGVNGNPTNGTGNITLKKVPKINFVDNTKYNSPDGRDSMITEATNALVVMLENFNTYARSNGLAANNGNYISITSLFRDVAYQQKLYDQSDKDGSVARPGRSNHGWGIAVDLQFYDKNGNPISNSTKNANIGFDLNQNPSLKWFLDNSYVYGFIIPWQLRGGSSVYEFWHFEYHGTSAKCLLSQHTNVRGYQINVNKAYNTIVVNPRTPTGTIAVYEDNNCGYKTLTFGDGSESLNTKLTKTTLSTNQTVVKDFLKGYFKNTLRYDDVKAKIITAGIMGNIQKESKFNPTAGFDDINGFKSVGLIQWNEKSYPDLGSVILGKSALQQIQKVVDGYTPSFQSFLNKCNTTPYLTPWYAGYFFAQLVEICKYCNKGEATYRNAPDFDPVDRSKFAEDFFNRFNSPTDTLFW